MSLSNHNCLPARTLCLFVCLLYLFAGVASAADAEKPAAAAAAPPQQPKADPFVVPDGTPTELFAYIEGLGKVAPEKRDRESVIEFIKKLGKARNEACDKILASAATVEEKQKAAMILLSTTAQMALRFGDAQAFKSLGELPAKFQSLNMPKIAAEAESAAMQVNLVAALRGMPGALPLDEAVKKMKLSVEKTPDMDSFSIVYMTIKELTQMGKTAETAELCNWAVKTFANCPDKKVLELLPMIEGTARRLQLLGKDMTIKGPLVDGKPYDLAEQKGKVVLVQYWATWCEPCLQEIVNVLKNYELYHDRGFEVVGISIDEDKAKFDEFLKESKLPWPMMLDSQSKESNAQRYGVIGVPVLILVDQQGKVVSLNARGEQLDVALEKLLGPPPKPATQKQEAAIEKMEPLKP